MNRSEIKPASPGLESYLARVETALASLPPAERREILLETRSHVLERAERRSGSTGDVLAELGAPEDYAQQFLPATDPAPEPEPSALGGLARLAEGKWTSLPLLFAIVSAYAVAVIATLLALSKLAEPDATGLWISQSGGGHRSFYLVASDPSHANDREILRPWFVPIMLLIALTVHLAMSALLKRLARGRARDHGRNATRNS